MLISPSFQWRLQFLMFFSSFSPVHQSMPKFRWESKKTLAHLRPGVAPIHIQLWLFDAEISEEFVFTLNAIIDWAGILIYMYKVGQGWILSIVLLRFIIKILICQTNIQIDKTIFPTTLWNIYINNIRV